MKITNRPERKEDFSVIRQINRKTFDTDAEANLIEALRKRNVPIISLVAKYNDIVIGHIFFSEVSLDGHCPNIKISGLAPMAVLPEYQQKGIGSLRKPFKRRSSVPDAKTFGTEYIAPLPCR